MIEYREGKEGEDIMICIVQTLVVHWYLCHSLIILAFLLVVMIHLCIDDVTNKYLFDIYNR